MALVDDLDTVGTAAAERFGALKAILPAAPASGVRAYVCAFVEGEARSWLVVDAVAEPVTDPREVRDAVAIAALCEIAEEAAFPGDLDELRAQLVAVRISEAPPGIEEAESAARALQQTLGAAPQLASPDRLEAIGMAAQRLERALDPAGSSPFAAAMRSAQGVVDELWAEVERSYLVPLG